MAEERIIVLIVKNNEDFKILYILRNFMLYYLCKVKEEFKMKTVENKTQMGGGRSK